MNFDKLFGDMVIKGYSDIRYSLFRNVIGGTNARGERHEFPVTGGKVIWDS